MNILIVEDDAILSTVLADHLRMQGHAVKTAFEAGFAEQLFKREYFDLVLADVVLADADGIGLLERFREKSREFSSIVISGFSDLLEKEKTRLRALGAQLVIEKPFAFSEIDTAIAELQKSDGRDRPGLIGSC